MFAKMVPVRGKKKNFFHPKTGPLLKILFLMVYLLHIKRLQQMRFSERWKFIGSAIFQP
jgi:hypothetical protein